jgi:ATP-dependent exoDNAse (exonuclease V) alpha subunit
VGVDRDALQVLGDKVTQVENDYDKEVYNGDLGVARTIDPEASEISSSSMAAR